MLPWPARDPWSFVRDGRTLTTDGPFGETKEALGGFYLIEAKDLDEVVRRLRLDHEARMAYQTAVELTSNDVERAFLRRRLAEVDAGATTP